MMTEQEVLLQISRDVGEIKGDVGELKGEMKACNNHLKTLNGNVQILFTQVYDNKSKVVELDAAYRERRGCEEDSRADERKQESLVAQLVIDKDAERKFFIKLIAIVALISVGGSTVVQVLAKLL